MSQPCILVTVSDLHCGSTVGLFPEGALSLDDGGTYTGSDAQAWLWRRWAAVFARLEEMLTARPRPWFLLLNGDVIDGDHHNTYQIVSRHPLAELDIARACLALPLRLKPDGIIVVRGTEDHTGRGASGEEGLAKALAEAGHPVIRHPSGPYSWWHFVGLFDGVKVDAAHHGRMGARPWTSANATIAQAAEIFFEYARDSDRQPDLAFRSHFHRHADSYRAQPVRVIQTPAFQLASAYVRAKHVNTLADIGGIITEFEGGRFTVHDDDGLIVRPSRTPAVQVS
jgi:hypothetical protein